MAAVSQPDATRSASTSIYEPGLLDSNAAAVFALAASRIPVAPRSATEAGLHAVTALERIASLEPALVPPLAWSYAGYALLLVDGESDLPKVSPSVKRSIEEGVASCAERLLGYVFPTGLYRDTKAEETCWTAGPLVVAQALLPEDARRKAWTEQAHRFFLNAYTTESDLDSDDVVSGKPLSARVTAANLFPDYTTENHGAFHPAYQACINNYAIPYLAYRDFVGAVPESLTWNWGNIHGVMRRIVRQNGRICAPAGTDYFPESHAEQIHYFALVAAALGDPLARRAAELAGARLRAFAAEEAGQLAGGELGGTEHIYWEYHFASFAALAYAILFPQEQSSDRGRAGSAADQDPMSFGSGPWSSRYARFIVHKTRRFNAGFAVKTILGRYPGSGYVAPSDGGLWTDHFCAQPSLSAVVRDVDGEIVPFTVDDHRIGHDASSAYAIGAYKDSRECLRRTVAMITHEQGVIHIDRVFRYGEQVRIFGSDADLRHSQADGPEFGPWRTETLNYRVVNDRLGFQPIAVETKESRTEFLDAERSVTSEGDWVMIGDRIGIVRLWGDRPWTISYRHETEPLSPQHYWKHDAWALNVTFECGDCPRGYGLMGGHAVLFVPADTPNELARIAERRPVRATEEGGDFSVDVDLASWKASYQVLMGHLIGLVARCSPMRPGLVTRSARCSPMRPGLARVGGRFRRRWPEAQGRGES